MKAIKKTPYRMTDFARIMKSDYYYVDKSRYIELIEPEASFFFFARPAALARALARMPV